jgi:hypothetical protein
VSGAGAHPKPEPVHAVYSLVATTREPIDVKTASASPIRALSFLLVTGAFALALGWSYARPGEADDAPVTRGSSEGRAVRDAQDWRAVSNALDHVIDERLALDGVQGSGPSDDNEFLRRLYLDLVGTVPTLAEVESFGSDRSADKRERKIDELIASEAFAENQATWWFRTLTGLSPNAPRGREGQGGRYLAGEGGKTFHRWLSKQIASNRPYNEMAEALITATGRTDENGAAGYMARWEGNANNMAGAVSKNFLGVQIQCAQCHDHIYETTWKQADFKGMAAFFAGTSARRVPEYQEIRRLRDQLNGNVKAGKAGKAQGNNAKAGKAQGNKAKGSKAKGSKATGGQDADSEMSGGMSDGGMSDGGMSDGGSGEMDSDGMGSPEMAPGKGAPAGGMSKQELAARMRELRKYANIVDVQDAKTDPRRAARMQQLAKKRKGLNEEQKERLGLMATTPKFWLGPVAADLPGISRRYLLARWVTAEDNPYFARALVNKMWGTYMGRGIVAPVDDFNSFNAPSHPEILEILAKDFQESGYDLKRLVRVLVNTRTYQRTSRWSGDEDPDPAQFAKAPIRPLTTEQLYFSLVRATGMEQRLDRASKRQGQAIQQAIFATFSFVFDDDEGKEEEDFAGSIPQGLFLMNGALLQRALSAGPERPDTERPGRKNPRRARRARPAQSGFEQLLLEEKSPKARVERIYLQAYGRKPEAAESRAALAFVGTRGDDRQAWEDFFWAVLNSAEFMTNH